MNLREARKEAALNFVFHSAASAYASSWKNFRKAKVRKSCCGYKFVCGLHA